MIELALELESEFELVLAQEEKLRRQVELAIEQMLAGHLGLIPSILLWLLKHSAEKEERLKMDQ